MQSIFQIFLVGLLGVVAINATVAFFIALYWQVKVILKFSTPVLWKLPVNPKNWLQEARVQQNNFSQFIAGGTDVELRARWIKAIKYVFVSYAALFLTVFLLFQFGLEKNL